MTEIHDEEALSSHFRVWLARHARGEPRPSPRASSGAREVVLPPGRGVHAFRTGEAPRPCHARPPGCRPSLCCRPSAGDRAFLAVEPREAQAAWNGGEAPGGGLSSLDVALEPLRDELCKARRGLIEEPSSCRPAALDALFSRGLPFSSLSSFLLSYSLISSGEFLRQPRL